MHSKYTLNKNERSMDTAENRNGVDVMRRLEKLNFIWLNGLHVHPSVCLSPFVIKKKKTRENRWTETIVHSAKSIIWWAWDGIVEVIAINDFAKPIWNEWTEQEMDTRLDIFDTMMASINERLGMTILSTHRWRNKRVYLVLKITTHECVKYLLFSYSSFALRLNLIKYCLVRTKFD